MSFSSGTNGNPCEEVSTPISDGTGRDFHEAWTAAPKTPILQRPDRIVSCAICRVRISPARTANSFCRDNGGTGTSIPSKEGWEMFVIVPLLPALVVTQRRIKISNLATSKVVLPEPGAAWRSHELGHSRNWRRAASEKSQPGKRALSSAISIFERSMVRLFML